jgi:SAM-dependent methyltransferase
MVKYVATAVALKCFSSNSVTRSLYRRLGNIVGDKRRRSGAMPAYYPERLRRILRLQRQHQLVKDGDRILELGTGWVHWEALTLRLFYDVEAVLFDVWDNRQLEGLKNYVRQLRLVLENGFDISQVQLTRAQSLIDEIIRVQSFDQLYDLLGFQYVVDSSGSLSQFAESSFDIVVSGGVLEHVKRESLPTLIASMDRILKPGGWAIHSIDTADHLEHYDRSVSPKLYLTFSERRWRCLCQNEVQYINRVQRGEWLELFGKRGFELIEEEVRRVDIGNLRLADRYVGMDRGDLECTVLKLALRKNAKSAMSNSSVLSKIQPSQV